MVCLFGMPCFSVVNRCRMCENFVHRCVIFAVIYSSARRTRNRFQSTYAYHTHAHNHNHARPTYPYELAVNSRTQDDRLHAIGHERSRSEDLLHTGSVAQRGHDEPDAHASHHSRSAGRSNRPAQAADSAEEPVPPPIPPLPVNYQRSDGKATLHRMDCVVTNCVLWYWVQTRAVRPTRVASRRNSAPTRRRTDRPS